MLLVLASAHPDVLIHPIGPAAATDGRQTAVHVLHPSEACVRRKHWPNDLRVALQLQMQCPRRDMRLRLGPAQPMEAAVAEGRLLMRLLVLSTMILELLVVAVRVRLEVLVLVLLLIPLSASHEPTRMALYLRMFETLMQILYPIRLEVLHLYTVLLLAQSIARKGRPLVQASIWRMRRPALSLPSSKVCIHAATEAACLELPAHAGLRNLERDVAEPALLANAHVRKVEGVLCQTPVSRQGIA